MARPGPGRPAPALTGLKGPPGPPLFQLDLSVITPMFGGSAVPRVVDERHPVRASSVRGQLRFWWRACQAPRFTSAADLYAEEALIWGAPASNTNPKLGPSPVVVKVTTLNAGTGVLCRFPANPQLQWDRSHPPYRYPPYATFPLRPPLDPEGAEAREGVRFRLTIEPNPHVDLVKVLADHKVNLQDAVEAALWAWICFGGIGARTRRGCGSLWCENDNRFQPTANPSDWLAQRAITYVAGQNPSPPGTPRLLVPWLARARYFVGDSQPPLDAWFAAIAPMQDLRQGYGIGRTAPPPGQNHPGRSFWPEPDSVRAEQNAQLGYPYGPYVPAHPAMPYFPRANLSLPLLFQQMRDTPTLQGALDGATRMASPIVLKPLATAANSAVPLALILNAPSVWQGPGVRFSDPGLFPAGIPNAALNATGRKINATRTTQPQPARPPYAHLDYESARDAFAEYVARRWNVPLRRLRP